MAENQFYDAAKETMSVKDRERYLNERLRDIVQYAYQRAPAFREKLDRVGAVDRIANAGSRVKRLWSQATDEHRLPIDVEGFDGLPHFVINHPDARALSTLFVQQMLERGFLASTGFYPTVAHNEDVITRYGDAVDEVFGLMASAIADDSIQQQLRGPEAHPPFARRS